MKLRHALAAAVATAALAPAALLAAPAAHADGELPAAQTSAGTTGDGTATPDPSAEPQPSTTGEETGGTETATGETGSPSGAGDTATSDGPEEAGDTGESGTGESGETGGTGESTGEAADGGTSEGTDGGSESDSDCAIDAADLKVQVVGLPSKLVAGGGWSPFTVKLTNTTDHSLDEVYPIIYAAPLADVDPQQLLRMQYRNPETGTWTRFSEWTEGQYFGMFQLDAHMTAELELRIRATDKAEAGDGIALVAGDYYNEDGSCGWSEEEWYRFTILAAGTDPGDDVPPAEPGKPAEPGAEERPGRNVKPQGGMKELPVQGNLAETGSSSALPLFALSGAAAVALGAGSVYVVRRRKAGGTGAAV